MSIQYKQGNKTFYLSYQDLKVEYFNFCAMNNEDFLKRIPEALHLACIICFLKEIPTYNCLNDTGIIHELTHILTTTSETPLEEIRKEFETVLKLV